MLVAYYGIVQSALGLLSSLSMLFGIYNVIIFSNLNFFDLMNFYSIQNKPKLLIPWMIFSILGIISYIVMMGIYMPILIIYGLAGAGTLLIFYVMERSNYIKINLILAINGYFIVCIYSLYEEMRGSYETLD